MKPPLYTTNTPQHNQQQHCTMIDVTMETSNNTIVAYYQTLSTYKLQKYL